MTAHLAGHRPLAVTAPLVVLALTLAAMTACDAAGRVNAPLREANVPADVGTTVDVAGDPPLPPTVSQEEVALAFGRWTAGDGFSCAIDETASTVRCWGKNTVDQAIAPAGAYAAVDAGPEGACALTNEGAVRCWGTTPDGAPAGTGYTGVSVDTNVACAIDADTALACWGDVAVEGAGTGWVQVAVGEAHVCALTTAGAVSCWGTGAATEPPDESMTALASGALHMCGLTDAGQVSCWGDNTAGQLDAPSGTYRQVLSTGDTSCARDRDGALACWGDDTGGKTRVPDGLNVAGAALGFDHVCAELDDGEVVCWGRNNQFQTTLAPQSGARSVAVEDGTVCWADAQGAVTCIGNDDEGQADPPVLNNVNEVALGVGFGCATNASTTVCWGLDGDADQVPIDDAPAAGLVGLALGSNQGAGLNDAGVVVGWGGPYTNGFTPAPGPYVALDVGNFHTCAVAEDESITCWGSNGLGQASPTDGSYTAVSTSTAVSCGAQASDGVVRCWGDPQSPLQQVPASGVAQLDLGVDVGCGIAGNGNMVCWGETDALNAGPPSGVTWDTVSVDDDLVCGLTNAGAVRCFGQRAL